MWTPRKSQSEVEDLADPVNFSSSVDVVEASILTLYYSKNFLIIDKPPYVRMDGDFDLTVEKLVLRLLPTVSLCDIKWVHQLDFATSGVLCIGLNKVAAAMASLAFQDRATEKEYLAIVHGHVDTTRWPLMPERPAKVVLNVIKTDSFPTLSGRPCWQDAVKTTNLTLYFDELHRLVSEGKQLSEDQERLVSQDFDSFLKNKKLRKALRKAVPLVHGDLQMSHHLAVDPVLDTVEGASEAISQGGEGDDQLLAEFTSKVVDPVSNPLVHIYRLPNDANKLIVEAPVADVAGDFRQTIGHAANPGRPSETCVRVLERGFYQGAPVSKLLLLPMTGRRHQLRLHCLALGHPIVGDRTYGSELVSAERMMLHAFRLRVPMPDPKDSLKRKRREQFEIEKELSVSAPDPFPLVTTASDKDSGGPEAGLSPTLVPVMPGYLSS